jgi:hypothetical protein
MNSKQGRPSQKGPRRSGMSGERMPTPFRNFGSCVVPNFSNTLPLSGHTTWPILSQSNGLRHANLQQTISMASVSRSLRVPQSPCLQTLVALMSCHLSSDKWWMMSISAASFIQTCYITRVMNTTIGATRFHIDFLVNITAYGKPLAQKSNRY